VLHRREGSEGDRPVAAKSGAPAPDDDPGRPKLLRKKNDSGDTKAEASAAKPAEEVSAGGVATVDEVPDHPILRRGKPAEEQGGRDLPEFNPALQPGLNPGTGARGPEPMARQIAVSDAGTSEPQDVTFAWSPAQRQQMEAEARGLAEVELLRVAPMRGLVLQEKSKADASAASTESASAAAVPALALEDEQFVPFDLDYNDYATVVFTGRYRPAAGARPGNAAQPAVGTWVVTVIAKQDGDKLVKLYSAVSDPRELDLYPEMRLVDAVDPDGYGRYALLFRQQKRDGVSWLLGRVSGYELQTLLETAAR
jgi:hypothetical protein